MKKRFALILLVLGFMSSIFGYSGYFYGEKELRIIKTEWFDIIYPQKCEQTALILKENADDLFKDLCTQFNTEPDFRMPVVITPNNQQFNAYWTSYPYNHIVVFDTALISDLAVFSETMLSTFKHELTHAVTYNLKNPFFKTLGKIFGDPVTVAPWLVTSGLAEGATVSVESAKGEGRLNDEYAMQNVKQAKIQNEFPGYFDVQTSTDVYPYGQFYYFNGAFNAWLQEKYGMEKYARLWYLCVNMGAFTVKSVFKKVYEKDLSELWQNFIQDYQVPENVEPDPVDSGFAADIFKSKVTNESGRVFSSLSGNEKGVIYLDEITDTVFFIPWEELQEKGEGVKPQKLFTKNYVYEVKSSIDGRYIIYGYYNTGSVNTKKSIGIYDTQTKSFFNTGLTGVEEGFIVKKDNACYFGCQNFSSQNYGISLYLIEENPANGKIKGINKQWSSSFEYDVMPYSLTPVSDSDGTFAFICKNKLDFSIAVWDVEGKKIKNYQLPQKGMVVRNLAGVIKQNSAGINDAVLTFSYTQKGSLPRYGSLSLGKNQYALSSQDISGGIYYPVEKESPEETVIYVSHLYNQTKVLKLIQNNSLTNAKAISGKDLVTKDSTESLEQPEKTEEPVQENNYGEIYTAASSKNRGIFIPMSFLTSRSFSITGKSESISLGLSYITGNPWDSKSTMIQAGYSPNMNSAAVQFDSTEGIKKSLYLELDGLGFKQAYGSLSLSSAIPFGNISHFILGASQFDYFGRGGTAEHKEDNYFYNGSAISAGFQSMLRSGPGRYEKAGIKFSTIFSYQYLKVYRDDGTSDYADYVDLGFKTSIYIPHLIPVECNRKYVYNLPLEIHASVFSGDTTSSMIRYGNVYLGANSLSDINSLDALNINAELVLFGYEIQKAVSFCNFFYAGAIKVSLLYQGGFDTNGTASASFRILDMPLYFEQLGKGELVWENYCALNFEMGLTPVVLNAGKINLSAKIIPDFVNKNCYYSFSATLK